MIIIGCYRDGDPVGGFWGLCLFGQGSRADCVPCLGNSAAELLGNPQALNLPQLDGFDIFVAERLVIGRVDFHRLIRKAGDQRGDT
jgi:hypothetical protein